MLIAEERDRIERAFASALASQLAPASVITVVFGNHAPAMMTKFPASANYAELAAIVVSECIASRWACDPALLDSLLEYLVTNKGRGELHPVLLRVRQKVDPNPSMYDATWLGGRPFFDRTDLRHRVKHLIERNERPILLISAGPATFGRSYSRYFLQYLEDTEPKTVHVVVAELSPGTGPSYQVEDLLGVVSAQLGVADPLPLRAGSDYPATAARWMLHKVMGRAGRWLFVLDGFGQNELNPEVRQTIQALAAAVPTGQYRLRARLVLIDYPHPLPNITPADVLEEKLHPPDRIDEAELTPCLVDWDAARVSAGRRRLAHGEIAKLAAGMAMRAPAAGRERLEALNAGLSDLLDLE